MGQGLTLPKQGWIWAFPLHSNHMGNALPNSSYLHFAWESKQSRLRPCFYQQAVTPFRKVLDLLLCVHVIPSTFCYYTLFFFLSLPLTFFTLHSSKQEYWPYYLEMLINCWKPAASTNSVLNSLTLCIVSSSLNLFLLSHRLLIGLV